MVPKYPFRVEVVYRRGPVLNTKTSNEATLPAAIVTRDHALKHPNTVVARVLVVLDETIRERMLSDAQLKTL